MYLSNCVINTKHIFVSSAYLLIGACQTRQNINAVPPTCWYDKENQLEDRSLNTISCYTHTVFLK